MGSGSNRTGKAPTILRELCGYRRGVTTATSSSLFSPPSTSSTGLSVISVSWRLVPPLVLVALVDVVVRYFNICMGQLATAGSFGTRMFGAESESGELCGGFLDHGVCESGVHGGEVVDADLDLVDVEDTQSDEAVDVGGRGSRLTASAEHERAAHDPAKLEKDDAEPHTAHSGRDG